MWKSSFAHPERFIVPVPNREADEALLKGINDDISRIEALLGDESLSPHGRALGEAYVERRHEQIQAIHDLDRIQ